MATKLPPLTRYRCALCNQRLREGSYVFSRWSKYRYCADLPACRKRARAKR